MKIAILDDLHNIVATLPSYTRLAAHEVTIWNDHTDDIAVLADRLKDVEALALHRERTAIPAALLERLPRLRLISVRGRTPHIDVAACTRHGVLVSTAKSDSVPDPSTTELTLALILMGLRDLPRQIDYMKAGKWQFGVGRVASGLTLGIYAYGRIGGAVANLARALGMKVQVWGRDASLVRARADGYAVAASRAAFFAESDVISMHMPLVESSRGIVREADLLLMKPTALFINTSRAGLVAPGALVNALRQGRPGRAAVDVYEQEPVTDVNHPLLTMPNVICTPHIGGVVTGHLETQYEGVFNQILAYGEGKPFNIVNPEALTRKS